MTQTRRYSEERRRASLLLEGNALKLIRDSGFRVAGGKHPEIDPGFRV
jgi:hypothetical protein